MLDTPPRTASSAHPFHLRILLAFHLTYRLSNRHTTSRRLALPPSLCTPRTIAIPLGAVSRRMDMLGMLSPTIAAVPTKLTSDKPPSRKQDNEFARATACAA